MSRRSNIDRYSPTAKLYGVSEGWVFKLVARWRAEGDAAFQARSRCPGSSPSKVSDETVELVVNLGSELSAQGLDAGPHTISRHRRRCGRRLSHRSTTLADMTGADVTESVLEAADASGVPFSGLTRMLVHHEVLLDVTAPHWAVDSALYAERRRDVTVAVAVVWLPAGGTTRCIPTIEAAHLDWLSYSYRRRLAGDHPRLPTSRRLNCCDMETATGNLGRLRPGEVRDGIERTLGAAAVPMSVRQIHASVEARLGKSVPESSVRSYLNLNSGPDGQFERVRRGVYKLS